jgi:hypothetical protein
MIKKVRKLLPSAEKVVDGELSENELVKEAKNVA